MIEEKIKTTVYEMFRDGKLLTEERQEITEQCVFFPDNLAVGKISISKSLPVKLYKFGGNASVSVHVSVPYPMTDQQEQEAIKYANRLCDEEVNKQFKGYTEWLTSVDVNWKKIEEGVPE
jgi:hypothetical protein